MVRIRHSHSGADIEGSPDNLRDLRSAVLSLAMKGQGQVSISAETGYDPTPYQRVLRVVVVSVAAGPTAVEVTPDDRLAISGSRENLVRLASFLDVPDRPAQGWHSHYEYFAGNEFIMPNSEPLVFSLRP